MAKNTIVQQFREAATDEQWTQLVADHSGLSKEEFEKKYNFSWNAVMPAAAEKGFYERKKRVSSPAPALKNNEMFWVSPQPEDVEKITRSVQINGDIYERLQALEHANGQYTHSAILNQLLGESLEKHGY